MKIAIAQLNFMVGNFEYNKFKIIDTIKKSQKQGVDLVVFAEQSISGTPAYSLLGKRNFLDKAEESLVEIAAFCDNISVLVGLPVQRDEGTVSAAAFIQNRQVLHYITKQHIGQYEDSRYITSGMGCDYVIVAGQRVGVALGYDVYSVTDYTEATDTVVFMGADRYCQGRIEWRYDLIADKAFVTGKNLVFVNQVGATYDVIYDGSSAVFDGKGKPISLLKSFAEDFAIVDTEAEHAPVEITYQDKIANVYRALRLGLRDYFDKNEEKTACLVLSGGIDSSVTAAMLVAALGADNVKALLMPSRYSDNHSAEEAERLAKQLGIKYKTIPLTDIYHACLDAIEPVVGNPDSAKLEEDFQLRLRTSILMAVCDKMGFVPINSSNKTEIAVGAETLYGDSSGLLSVLGDLYKSDVFALARYINRDSEIIPEKTLLKTPSSEMQLDESAHNQLPPYDVLDAILYRIIERGQCREEIIDAGFEEKEVNRVCCLIYEAIDKCYQFCPILKVSSVPVDRAAIFLPKSCKRDF